MALSDPFSTTYEGAKKQQQGYQDQITSGVGQLASGMQTSAMLKQFGLMKTEDPSVEDYQKAATDYAKKSGHELKFNMAADIDDDTKKKFLKTAFQQYGIPEPKSKTVIDYSGLKGLPAGLSLPLPGGASYTAQKQEKTLPQQIAEYSAAQKMMETAGLSGQASVNAKGGVSIKPPTEAAKKTEDAKSRAQKYADDVEAGTQTYSPHAFSYGERGIYTDALRGKGIDVGKADADYMVSKMERGQFEKTVNNVFAAEKTFRLNADNALRVVKNSNIPDVAPIVRKAILYGEKELKGNPEAAKVYAAVYTAAVEYAKIATNFNTTGQLTDSAREEAIKMLDYAATNGQLDGLIGPDGVLTQDAGNRITALQQTRDMISNKYKKGGGSLLDAIGMGTPAQPAQPAQGQNKVGKYTFQ